MLKNALYFFAFLSISIKAFTQGSGNLNATLEIRSIMSLNVFVGSAGTEFVFDTDKAYRDGIIQTGIFTVQVKSNSNWRLSVSSLTSYFTALDEGSKDIPSSIIQLKEGSSKTFNTLQVFPVEVANGSRGDYQTSGNSFDLDMRMDPGLAYSGGSYSLNIIYTLAAD